MALSNYVPKTVTVSFPGGSANLRGLSLDDVTEIMGQHLDDLDHIVQLFNTGEDARHHMVAGASYILRLVKDAPALAAQIIAIAADEPEAIATARRLPLPLQISALRSIASLTFEEAGGIKKFIETLQTMGNQLAPLKATVSNTSARLNESTATSE